MADDKDAKTKTNPPSGRDDTRHPKERDLTKGSIIRNLWSLGWPITVTTTVMMVGPIIDMIWIGKLGPAEMAGVGISGLVVALINSLINGLFTGLKAIVARAVGAGNKEEANEATQQAFVIGVALSLALAIIGQLFATEIMKIWKLDADVIAAGASYMRIELIGIFTMSFGSLASSVMQASGDAQWPMRVTVVERIFHILLCPFLIFGWAFFPKLGVSGAALSGVIAQGLGGAVLLWILFSGRTRLQITLSNFKFKTRILWRMVKIGIPSAISGIHFSIGSMLFMWFIAPFGTLAVAGHNLVSRVDMFVMLPAIGLGSAAGILAAQNLGAGHPERSAKTAWVAIGWLTGIMAVFSAAIWFFAGDIVKIFNPESQLIDLASTFLKIQIASYMCNGLMFVMMSVMNSVGDTLIAFIIDLVTMWGIRVPLAVILPHINNMGVYGIRWALVADTVSSAVVFIIYFLSGRWKHKKI